jgi:translocation and assembly module TamA
VRGKLAQYSRHRIPWNQGDLYDPEKLELLRTRLASTGLFSTIRVKPAEHVPEDRRLPIVVELERGKLRSIGAGVRYSSSEGPGGTAYWEHRDLFGRAERLRIAGDVSMLGESGKLTFRKPDFLSVSQTLVFDTSYEVEDTEAFESRKFKSSLGVERPFGLHWTALAGGAFEIGPVEEASDLPPGSPTRDIVLVGLPLTLRRDTSNDLLDPTKGWKLDIYVAPYLEQLGSDVSFYTGRIVNSLYIPFDERRRVVFAGRASLGTISGAQRFDIPADKRFYAGGGGSVRGFGYQLVGPLDPDEDPLGGRSLVEGSAELRWRFMDSFGVVPFIDVGNVYDEEYPAFDRELFWGAGLGVRYYSRVGPIRLDIATPLNPRDGVDDPVQFYISLGQAF